MKNPKRMHRKNEKLANNTYNKLRTIKNLQTKKIKKLERKS